MPPKLSEIKVAIVHDDFIQFGGAERLVETFLEIFPKADLFSSYVSKKWRSRLLKNKKQLRIKTSFMQKFPFVNMFYKFYGLFFAIAFESFDFSKYDLVISSSARFAHGVITKPSTIHVAYINSVGRMFWRPSEYFRNKTLQVFISPAILFLRVWSKISSSRPDYIISNSKNVQSEVKKFWGRNSKIIYPFHDIEIEKAKGTKDSLVDKNKLPYLVVTRLERWKKVDIAVKACSDLKIRLVVIGDGKDRNRLESIADKRYVQFAGRVSDTELIEAYKNSRALIITQKEDFGITSLESQACGTPVIAYQEGGALETIIKGKTGEFFQAQTYESLSEILKTFDASLYKCDTCQRNADSFTKEIFKRSVKKYINDLL